MRGDYLERLCALLPEVPPETVKKVVESLNAGFSPREISAILGFPDAGTAVLATKQASMFLVIHRFQPVELPTSAATGHIVDALSDDQALELLSTLSDMRAELLKAKVKSL